MSCSSKLTTRPRSSQVTFRGNGHIIRDTEHRHCGKCRCVVCHVKLSGAFRQTGYSCAKCKTTLHRDCFHPYSKRCTGHRADERSTETAAISALTCIADNLMPAVEKPSGGAPEAAVGRVPNYSTASGECNSAVRSTIIVAADRSTSVTDRPVPVALVIAHGGPFDKAEEDPVGDTVIVVASSVGNVGEVVLGGAPEEPPVEVLPDNDRHTYVQDDSMSVPQDSWEGAVSIRREKISYDLEDFDLIEEVGRGSYGKVVTAVLKGTNDIYALKALEKCMIKPPLGPRRVYTEQRVFIRCTGHPFLVGLLACMQTRTHLIFVTEFACGGDLRHRLNEMERLPVEHVRFYAAEIALALGYLHAFGIIHRDLKPENILLDREGHVKVADYGLCRDGLGENERTTSFCGSAIYMAPEIVLGQPYGRSADWWSYGIIIHEMLLGFSPFEFIQRRHSSSDNPDAFIYQAIVAPVSISLPNWIGLPAVALLEGLLCKLPSHRLCCTYDVRELLAHPFFEEIDFEQVERKEVPPPVVPPSRWKLTERVISRSDDSDDENSDVVVPNFQTTYPQRTGDIDQSLFEDFDYFDDSLQAY